MAVPQDSGSDLEGNSVLEFWGMKKKKKKVRDDEQGKQK